MPIIYLSPSTQEYNPYVNTGSEEEWMNRLADAMVPLLDASGILYERNTPDMSAYTSILASNAGNFDLHLALHSNAAGEGNEGAYRGIIAFYYPGSAKGLEAATLLADGLKAIYPFPDQVTTQATTTIGEVRRVKAPAVLLELGFHDNEEDAAWIVTHIPEMAYSLVLSLTEFFGIPFFSSSWEAPGVVETDQGALTVYARPDTEAYPIASLYDGAEVTVLNQYQGWYLLRFGEAVGYAASAFIRLV